jgi:aspartate beta-hydroxylase
MDMGAFYNGTAKAIRSIYDSRIEGPPVLEMPEQFPEGARFAAAWRDIRDEAEALAAELQHVPRFHEIMREQHEISANDGRDWRLFVLKAYGVTVAANMARCPVLAGIVRDIPSVLSASISFMAPHKHIPRHRGPFRGVLRFYMALSMPKPVDGRRGAVLAIDDGEYCMRDGECLLWDDTYPHEVWNDSDEVRTVLLLDVWRRGMPLDMAAFSRALIAMVRVGMRVRGFA